MGALKLDCLFIPENVHHACVLKLDKACICNSLSFDLILQTFSLEVVTSGNGTIVAQALNYWQTLSSTGGGVAVGLIVQVCGSHLFPCPARKQVEKQQGLSMQCLRLAYVGHSPQTLVAERLGRTSDLHLTPRSKTHLYFSWVTSSAPAC